MMNKQKNNNSIAISDKLTKFFTSPNDFFRLITNESPSSAFIFNGVIIIIGMLLSLGILSLGGAAGKVGYSPIILIMVGIGIVIIINYSVVHLFSKMFTKSVEFVELLKPILYIYSLWGIPLLMIPYSAMISSIINSNYILVLLMILPIMAGGIAILLYVIMCIMSVYRISALKAVGLMLLSSFSLGILLGIFVAFAG